MAQTGISIIVSNTVLDSPPRVNSNSMLVVVGATTTTGSSIPFTLDTPFLLRSADDLKTLGITEENNVDVYRQVNDFYAPVPGINNSGTLLWLVGTATFASAQGGMVNYVLKTVVNGFQYRPRNILLSTGSTTQGGSNGTQVSMQGVVTNLYSQGFGTVLLMSVPVIDGQIATAASQGGTLIDLSTLKAGMVGTIIFTNRQADRPCVGAVGGWLAQLSVGTSIGDTSLQSFGDSLYFTDATVASSNVTWINTPCASVKETTIENLGSKQYIFPRTRPPRNGLWLNDGATAEDPTTALSTLEAARTIASIVDDVRAFLTPYINSKVPVNKAGDINPSYKRVVLDGMYSTVATPYIENGDVSDIRFSLRAMNDDMTGTKTWEVTVEILDAPTLRWINAYVFYVKSLS